MNEKLLNEFSIYCKRIIRAKFYVEKEYKK